MEQVNIFDALLAINIVEVTALISTWTFIFITAKKLRTWLIKPAIDDVASKSVAFNEKIETNSINIDKNAIAVKELEILLTIRLCPEDVRVIEDIYDNYIGIGGKSSYVERMVKEWRASYLRKGNE